MSMSMLCPHHACIMPGRLTMCPGDDQSSERLHQRNDMVIVSKFHVGSQRLDLSVQWDILYMMGVTG